MKVKLRRKIGLLLASGIISIACGWFGASEILTAGAKEAVDYTQGANPATIITPATEEGRKKIEDFNNGYISGSREWQGLPNMEISEGGTYYAAIMTGGVYEDKDNYIAIQRSKDGCAWDSAPVAVIDHDYSYCRVFDEVLFEDANGYLWCSYTQEVTSYQAFEGKDPNLGIWATYTKNPDDEVPVWETPFRIVDIVAHNNTKPYINDKGEIYITCSTFPLITAFSQPEDVGVFIYKFTDYGRPWERVSVVKNEDHVGFFEGSLTRVDENEYLIAYRTVEGLSLFRSTDRMKTWVNEGLWYDKNTGKPLSLTSSKTCIFTLPDGGLLLAYHDNETAGRSMLTMGLSYDKGKSFPHKILIMKEGEVSYPSTFYHDGMIYVSYDKDRHGNMRTLYSAFTVEDVKAGKIVSEEGKLNALIDDNAKTELTVNTRPGALYAGQNVNEVKRYLSVEEFNGSVSDKYFSVQKADGSDTLTQGENVISVRYGCLEKRITVTAEQMKAVCYTLKINQTEHLGIGEDINKLKKYITLTAKYIDGSEQTVTSYMLDGRITGYRNKITLCVEDKKIEFEAYGKEEESEPAGCGSKINEVTASITVCLALSAIVISSKTKKKTNRGTLR